MDEPIAGPSKPSSRRRSSNLGNTGSSDEIEEVQLTSKYRSRPARPTKEPQSRPEHPQAEAAEVSVTAGTRRIPSKSASGSSVRKAITTSSRVKEKGKGKEKAKQADKDPIVLVEGSTDEDEEEEDEPVFVGKSLAKKYSFKSGSIVKSNTSSSSSILITDEVKAESKRKTKPKLKADPDLKPNHPPLPLLAPVENVKPPPVPAWLGKTSVLLQIPYCVVCKVRWKKENGAARWRHISTCFPPLYRPPNPPPDLPQLVHEGLMETSGASIPSLLELHMNASPEAVDNRIDRKGPKPPQKLRGLAKMINVRPAEDRGDMWEGEIEDRLTTMFGRPRTPEPRSPSAHSALHSPMSSPATAFQSTQPLGESALAEHYSREVSMADDDTFEATEDADMDEIPMPPSSQQRPMEDDKENEDPQDLFDGPFRSRGGSRAEGDLPNKRSAIWQDWDCKRYRTDAFSPIR